MGPKLHYNFLQQLNISSLNYPVELLAQILHLHSHNFMFSYNFNIQLHNFQIYNLLFYIPILSIFYINNHMKENNFIQVFQSYIIIFCYFLENVQYSYNSMYLSNYSLLNHLHSHLNCHISQFHLHSQHYQLGSLCYICLFRLLSASQKMLLMYLLHYFQNYKQLHFSIHLDNYQLKV